MMIVNIKYINEFIYENLDNFSYIDYFCKVFINDKIYNKLEDNKIYEIKVIEISSILYICYYLIIFYLLIIKLELLEITNEQRLECIAKIFNIKTSININIDYSTKPHNIEKENLTFDKIKIDYIKYIQKIKKYIDDIKVFN